MKEVGRVVRMQEQGYKSRKRLGSARTEDKELQGTKKARRRDEEGSK